MRAHQPFPDKCPRTMNSQCYPPSEPWPCLEMWDSTGLHVSQLRGERKERGEERKGRGEGESKGEGRERERKEEREGERRGREQRRR